MAEDTSARNGQIPSIVTGSIDDYLVGLADGLQRAQRQLNQMALVSQPGEPSYTYQIPRLDFELKMSLEMFGAGGGGAAQLRFRPASAARAAAADISSTLRGALVAVPSLAGKSPPVLRVALRRIEPRKYAVTASVFTAAGERLAGVDVHFNIDRERSKTQKTVGAGLLPVGVYDGSAYDGGVFDDAAELHPGTGFWDGLVPTNADGVAEGVLDIAAAEPPGIRVFAVVDAAGQTETVVFVVE